MPLPTPDVWSEMEDLNQAAGELLRARLKVGAPMLPVKTNKVGFNIVKRMAGRLERGCEGTCVKETVWSELFLCRGRLTQMATRGAGNAS